MILLYSARVGMLILLLLASIRTYRHVDSVSRVDADFMNTASQANMAEIAAGKLASQKSKTKDVRQFADSMVADHTVAQKELSDLAEKEHVSLIQSPDTEHEHSVEQLNTMAGRQFDSAYMNLQLMDHQVAVQLFQQESQTGRDSLARTYAAKYLPKLRHHQMMADELWRRLSQ